MSRYIPYNPNPAKKCVGDCTVRAISKALNQDWEQTYAGLTAYGFMLSDMPSANHVWGTYLEDKGFIQYLVDRHGKRPYTVNDFCSDNPTGTYILAISGHVVCVQDGCYYDSWDSGGEIPIYYWAR